MGTVYACCSYSATRGASWSLVGIVLWVWICCWTGFCGAGEREPDAGRSVGDTITMWNRVDGAAKGHAVAHHTVKVCISLAEAGDAASLKKLSNAIGRDLFPMLSSKDTKPSLKRTLSKSAVVLLAVSSEFDNFLPVLEDLEAEGNGLTKPFVVLKEKGVLRLYLPLSRSDKAYDRAKVARVLRYGPACKSSIDTLVRLIGDKNWAVVSGASYSIAILLADNSINVPTREKIARNVLASYRKHKDTPAASGLLEAMAALGPAAKGGKKYVLDLLKEYPSTVVAAYTLARIDPQDQKGVVHLVEILKHGSPERALHAGDALMRLGKAANLARNSIQKYYPEATEGQRARKKQILQAVGESKEGAPEDITDPGVDPSRYKVPVLGEQQE